MYVTWQLWWRWDVCKNVCDVTALVEVGGWERMEHRYMEAAANYTYRDVALYDNRTCGMPNPRAFHIFQPATSSTYPWPGMIIGLTILATNYFCTDQVSQV